MVTDNIIEEIEKRLKFSRNIVGNEHFLDWFSSTMLDDSEEYERLFQPNIERFKALFGNQDFSFKLDRDYYVWRVETDKNKIYCISHDCGTFYQVFYSGSQQRFTEDQAIGASIVNFLKGLTTQMAQPMAASA